MFFKESRTDFNQQTNKRTTSKPEMIFEVFLGIITKVPAEGSFPVPLKLIDVVRRTSTTLDVFLENRKNDYWNVDGRRELSEPWTSFSQRSQY